MFVINDGAKIYWTEQGTGPPILLIMGLSFTHDMWFRVVPALAASYRLVMFDNRGMGRSEVPRGRYSIHQMAKDSLAVMDAAGVNSAHVLGASMGGMIAQEVAIRYPKRVKSLILACTSYGGILARWPAFQSAWAKAVLSTGSQAERERLITPLLYAPSTPADRIEEDLALRARCEWSSKGFLGQFFGILPWTSYRRLPKIKAPTVVIHGDQDRLIPLQNGKIVAKRIPGAEFHLIRNAGHVLKTSPKIAYG